MYMCDSFYTNFQYMNTALHEAAKYGHTDCVTYLVEKKADVNSCSVVSCYFIFNSINF